MNPKSLKKTIICLFILAFSVFVLDIGCFFYRTIGIPCPGCGMTRAYFCVLNLNFDEAFKMHPLWPITVPVIILALLKDGIIFHNPHVNKAVYIFLIFLFLSIYAYRMILYFPDTEPMVFNDQAIIPKLWKIIQTFI